MKPEYKVPLMEEIEALPWNGYNVVSTFSGAGGSCLGYRMAGFRVLWANEFIPEAQEVYKLNHPNSVLNTKDIRAVNADDILGSIALRAGEIDILDGSPPCASFSTAGKRSKGWGEVKQYSSTKQRVDDLFFEYARLVKGLQPKVFVAENVSGLVKGVAKGYFKLILQELKDCGYNVKAKVLDASWLGVPQRRQRLIFIGVRNDIDIVPVYPKPLGYRYTVREAIPKYPHDGYRELLTERMAKWWENTPDGKTLDIGCKKYENGKSGITKTRIDFNKPCCTVMQKSNSGTRDLYMHDRPATPTISELKRIMAFPDNFQLTGNFVQQWERLGRAVPPVMMSHIAKPIEDQILCKI